MEPDPSRTNPSSAATPSRRSAIAKVIEQLRANRAAGRVVDDPVVCAAHPELMPELGVELEKLRRVAAARAAAGPTEIPKTTAAPASADAPAQVGIRAVGYTVVRELSRGGQAVVYLANQLSTGRRVVLKVMREGPFADAKAMARFEREVQSLAALNHPNIVTIFDTGTTADGSHYIAMEYIAGTSLDDFMRRRHEQAPEDPSRLLRCFLKICAAVSVAHLRGIVHRDLKPGNIRIDERGEPQILDFGLARTAMDRFIRGSNSPVSVTGEFLGSLPWSSPEQASGNPDLIDARTDVYSLGVILYQMLTGGRFPYEVVGNIRDVLNNILTAEPTPPSKVIPAGTTDSSRRPSPPRPPAVNEAIERIVLKALAKKPEKRYQSAGELGRDIASYLSGAPTAWRATAAKPAQLSARNRLIAGIAVGIVALAGIFGVFRIWLRSGAHAAMASAPPIAETAPGTDDSPRPPAMPPPLMIRGACHLEGDEFAITPHGAQSMFVFGDPSWSNYDLNFELRLNRIADPECSVLFHWSAPDTYCHFLIAGWNNSWGMLETRQQGKWMGRVGNSQRRVEPDEWQSICVKVRGSHFACLVNGAQWFSTVDDSYTHGRVALQPGGHSSARYRNIRVTDPQGKLLWSGPPDLSALPSDAHDPDRSAVAPPSVGIDLLSLIDLSKNTLAGAWAMRENALLSSGEPAQIEFPHVPAPMYDFRIEYSRPTAGGIIALRGSKGGKPFEWVLAETDKTISGIGQVDGHPFDQNASTRRPRGQWLTAGARHTIVLSVREKDIFGYLDTRQAVNLNDSRYTSLGLDPSIKADRPDWLGLRVDGDPVRVESATIFDYPTQAAPTVAATPVAPPPPPPAATIPADAVAYDGQHFEFIPGDIGWNDAAAKAQQMGGHLACPRTQAQLEFLEQCKGEDATGWIGGSADNVGHWTWTDGKPIDADRLPAGPLQSGFRYLFLSRSGKISARPESGKIDGATVPTVEGFICQWDQ